MKYGNRETGIKLMSFNKGNTFLINSLDTIKQIIDREKPHVLSIQEARLRQNCPLEDVQIPDYILHTDGLYQAGKTARNVVYTHRDLIVKVRTDLLHPDIAMIPMKLGFANKTKINVLSFYRQWHTQESDTVEKMTEVSNLIECQALRFKIIIDTWTKLIDENRETISLSDTNLHSSLLLEEDNVPRSILKYLNTLSQPHPSKRCGYPQ